MNTEQTSSAYCHSPPWHEYHIFNDDRIYNDSKGRPVGLAGKVNRVTCSVEKPVRIPLMTPEDKIHFNACFDKCVDNTRQFLLARNDTSP